MKDYKILDQLGLRHDTDKASNGHDYLKYYAKHLPDTCGKLLEIGAWKGASLRLWKDVYGCEIHTIDLFKEFGGKYLHLLERDGFKCHQGDQSNIKFLSTIKDKFDVIVEDGSHNSADQLASFTYHFQHNLNPGGLYVVEDLHACNEPFYRAGMTFDMTMLSMIQNDKLPYSEMIKSVHLYEDKIAFIEKC